MHESIISRFAPSPTGQLHLGNAFSAVRAHDLARAWNGRFLLRIEDIDPARSRDEYVAGMEEDLRWLGLAWDETPIRQSARLHLYQSALDRLKHAGMVYPCFCTRAEIAASASAPQGPDGPVYPGTCRRLSERERAARMAATPHGWRLDMAKAVATAGELTWHDTVAGLVHARPEAQGDVVLARKDAPTSYHLAVTIDDAAQGVTDVVRGADLFAATHIHVLLQALLGLTTPRYHHHPLIADEAGERLAKRNGAPTLAALRAAGVPPMELLAKLRAGDYALYFPPR